MRARPFQPPRLADVRRFVKARLQLDQRCHRFARLCRLAQRLDNRAVAAGAIERLLDRKNIGVARRLLQKADHHIEGLVRVMQQHVLLPDCGKHVAVMVLHPFRHARRERRPQQIAAAVQHQFLQIGNAQQTAHLYRLGLGHMQLLHDQRCQLLGRSGADFQADHLAAPPPLQRRFKLAHQVLGLILDLQVAVAQHAEGAMAQIDIAGKQHPQMQKQQLFQRQKAVLAGLGGQRHKARNLLRDRQQRLQRAAVAAALQLQRQAKAGVGDEGKGMRRVDGQRRQQRKHRCQKMRLKEPEVARGQLGPRQQGNPLCLHLAFQAVEGGLLGLHQAAGIGVDQQKLFRRGQPVFRQRHIPGPRQFTQPGDADGVEFVQVGGRDRQEAQPFQQWHTRVRRLVQNAPVEGQPAEFPVEKPFRPGRFRVSQRNGRRRGGFKEISLCHRGLVRLVQSGKATGPTRACPARWRQGRASRAALRPAPAHRAAPPDRGRRQRTGPSGWPDRVSAPGPR